MERLERILKSYKRDRLISYNNLIKAYYSLSSNELNSLYDYKSALKTYNKYRPCLDQCIYEEVGVSLRYCRRCQYLEFDEEIDCPTPSSFIKAIDLDFESILITTYNNFESYWDQVLVSYKRPSARQNRLAYLINRLDDELHDSETVKYPTVVDQISRLKSKYELLIS